MTVEQLYKAALAEMPANTQEDDSLRQYAVGWTNLMLMECLKYQNATLAAAGQPELEEAPTLSSVTDEIPYSAQLVSNAMRWGMASRMSKDDDDNYHEQDFRKRYINACVEYTPLIQTSIENVYGGKGEDNADTK